MPRAIHDPQLPHALYQYLAAQITKSPAKRVPALRQFLKGQKKWSLATSAAVDECINNESPMSLDIRQRLIVAMDANNTTLESLYTPVLLVWGFNQSWALDIDTEMVMHHWAEENNASGQNTAACYRATSFLQQLNALAHDIPAKWRQSVFVQASQTFLTCAQTWNSVRLPPTRAGAFFVNLGYAVEHCPDARPQVGGTLRDRWVEQTLATIGEVNFSEKMCFSRDIVDSNLPGQYKLDTHKGLQTMLWLMAKDTFLPLLPESEAERFKMLPFDEPEDPGAEMEDWAKAGYIENNMLIMRKYCPQMYPLITLATKPDDWCIRAHIQAWVDQFNPANPMDRLDLPEGIQP